MAAHGGVLQGAPRELNLLGVGFVGRRSEGGSLSDLRIDVSGLRALAGRGLERAAFWREPALAALRGLALVAALVVFPFVLLIRGGVVAYGAWGLGTWPSLGLAILATAAVLGIYATAVARWLGAGEGARRIFVRGAMGVGVAYVAYALVFVASANVKSEDVRNEYRSLHPLLRVAASALVLADPESVITDAGRVREDYGAMGLPEAEASLHYLQADGYAHALDLRTIGRPLWRNLLVRFAFEALGFDTRRHVGTADHLHVSLPLAE
ncbi:MAG TPA: hypothetical protein VFQ22_08025 [Longimicrobiales bacterium]|nr:hypothetical protein [Longimicrobiales bacterium]